MPSTTPKQARLMAAVAHGWHKPGGGGPPVSVAKDFNRADKGSTMLSKGMKPVQAGYAKGGPVLCRTREFLKEKVEFRDKDEGDATADADQNYEKGSKDNVPPNTKKVWKLTRSR